MLRWTSPNPSLESLRKEAKHWLKALKAGDAAAWTRYRTAVPQASAAPTLRDVQLALARERGLDGWTQLKTSVEQAEAARRSLRELADEMLRQMIWHGDPAVGARLLQAHPELASLDLYTAAACGDLAAVQQRLGGDQQAASLAGGPMSWPPLLYVAYSRLPGHDRHAVEIAKLLLDHGADVNARWMDDWQNPFTVLTGVIALGEGVKPPHPRADELAALLLERGADPYDRQALYNTSIVDDETHWLDVLWNGCVARGTTDKWRDVPPTSSMGKTPVSQLDYLLGNAVAYNHRRRAAWLLEHGAVASHTHAYSGRPLLEEALVYGHVEIADLLRRHGAPEVAVSPQVEFQVACMQLDRGKAAAMAAAMPELLQHAEPLLTAARQGRRDVVELLLDLGMPVDLANNQGMRAVQLAVASDARDVVQLLLDRGSQVDTPTQHYGGALGFAAHFGRHDIARLLAPLSRDVHNMVSLGIEERLTELFAADPALVNQVHFRMGYTPLFTLPADEDGALRMARLLLAHGADARARNREGATAGEQARRRGRIELAELLGA